jgi:2-dehydropantoate 2-reductase
MGNKYLVIGMGGVGGSIAGFLALAGLDVAAIARGAHLQAVKDQGLTLRSELKGEQLIPLAAYAEEEYVEKADVIFVCVKGYSLDTIGDILRRTSYSGTLIIPILNMFGTGDILAKAEPSGIVLDGCIYIVGFVTAPGEITQMGRVFRLVFGQRQEGQTDPQNLEAVAQDLTLAGIKNEISGDIRRDTFSKWSYISAMACTGAYFNTPMAPLQKEGREREIFCGLAAESIAIGQKLGIALPEDILARHLRILDNLAPESTASLQKDLEAGHVSEIDGQLFAMIRLGESLQVEMPTYRLVAEKFSS